MGIFDLLFPKYCVNCKKLGQYLCDTCFSYLSYETVGKCLVCGLASIDYYTHPGCKRKYEIDGSFASIVYSGVAKKLIYQFKYKPYVSDLQKFLGELLYENLIQNEYFQKIISFSSILVPIPLHKKREKMRGYNHAMLLAEGLGSKFNVTVEQLLVRVKETKSQYGLKQKEREKNMQSAFAVCSNAFLSSCPNILLVDDILTTGATLKEAARVLKRNGAKKVFGIALAQD